MPLANLQTKYCSYMVAINREQIQIKRSHRASLFVYNNNGFIVLSVIAQGGKQFVVFRFCADSYAKAIVA